jgi:uncharacterized membrane protein YphA (DoxX/SURF4 family)
MYRSWLFFGRITYSIPLSITGIIYLINPNGTVESLTSFIPGGSALIYVAGLLWLCFGLAIAFNFKTRQAAFCVIGLILAHLILVDVPAATTGEHLNIVWFELLRNLSLMGGAFFIIAQEMREMRLRPKALPEAFIH